MKKNKKVFTVEMVCEVMKKVTVECIDEETARQNPWDHATDEMETCQLNWRIISVKEETK